MSTKSCNKVAKYYTCDNCDYYTCRKSSYDKHLSTLKHQINTFSTKSCKKVANDFICKTCNKIYKERTGLWRHTKLCKSFVLCNDNDTINFPNNNNDYIDNVLDKELITMLVNQNNKLMDIIQNGTHNINSNNTTNTTAFNLNLFLNETCKDALNITDFVNTIKLSIADLEYTGRNGYIEGITNIILHNLKDLELHQRPIHCSDFKREVLYIKEKDKWEKESNEKPIMIRAIKTIANENIKKIKNWKDLNPDCTDSDSNKNNLYLKIVSNSMNGLNEEESKKNIDKIISNVAKETVIQKSIL